MQFEVGASHEAQDAENVKLEFTGQKTAFKNSSPTFWAVPRFFVRYCLFNTKTFLLLRTNFFYNTIYNKY